MKYKIGDKVKYDDGEWLLYGTVSAVYEHSVCPFYRVNIERKEKKSGRHSIVQFEFELEADNIAVDNEKEQRQWLNSEIEYLKEYYGVHHITDIAKVLKRGIEEIEEKWKLVKAEPERILKMEPKPEPIEKRRRRRKQEPPVLEQEPEQEPEKLELAQKPKEETPKKTRGKRGEAWGRNLENYRKGEKSNTISTWMAQNRREYKNGKLPEEKFEKLMQINFPFDAGTKKKRMITGTTD